MVDGRELIKDKEVIGKHEDKVKAVIEHTIFPLIQSRLIHNITHMYDVQQKRIGLRWVIIQKEKADG